MSRITILPLNGMIKERIDITMAKNKFFTIHQKWKKQKSNCEVRMRDWDRISGGEEIMLYFENVNIVSTLKEDFIGT
uniref:Bm1208, isoform b n=1 Tax=Brugia malayi TaxID=6279 RepID=A0A1I9G0Q7_BRUMA|nr:Bm1208, isoform b [Brugia malayi]